MKVTRENRVIPLKQRGGGGGIAAVTARAAHG